MATEVKPTNPKDLLATNKPPLHLWPETATLYGCAAMLNGALKYGRNNWRVKGVKASVYYDAARRHMNAWFEGEDIAGDSGVFHLGHALACLAILVDAQEAGCFIDDRNYPGGYLPAAEGLQRLIGIVRDITPKMDPEHFTLSSSMKEDDIL